MKDKKVTDVPGDVLKLFRGESLNIMTQLINNIRESEKRTKNFTDLTMIALEKTPKHTKCRDHSAITLITYIAKIIARILTKKIERKIEDGLGEDQFGFSS
jgi:hypothetical protein